MNPTDKLVCELCAGERFEPFRIPGQVHESGLLACRDCRLVYWPKPAPPKLQGVQTPVSPDLKKGWGGGT